MLPSQVRDRILMDHAVIRDRLSALSSLIEEARSGDSHAGQQLGRRGRSFLEFFIAHIELENRLLVPALRQVDAWGDVRADRVRKEHAEQMTEVQLLLEEFGDPFTGSQEIATRLEDFIAVLEVDMAAEEKATLNPDLLRDDVVGIDVEAG